MKIIRHLGFLSIFLSLFLVALPSFAELSASYSSTGVVTPARKTVVSAKIMGRIETIPFESGDKVKQGNTLIKLNSAELQANLASARASEKLAATELKHLRRQEDKLQKLRANKSVSQDQLDNAEFSADVAEEKLAIAKANVARVLALLQETEIKAPFDAIITKKFTEIGEVTSPGSPLMTLEDHSQLKFETRVKEKNLGTIKLGQRVFLKIDALGHELEGKIVKVVPSGHAKTHNFLVEIALPPQQGLYPGMFGKVRYASQ